MSHLMGPRVTVTRSVYERDMAPLYTCIVVYDDQGVQKCNYNLY